MVLFLAALAVPLLRLDRAAPRAAVAGPARVAGVAPVAARARFSHLPREASLWAEGRELAAWTAADGLDWRAELLAPMLEDKCELTVKAAWPDGAAAGGETAVELTVQPEEREALSRTFWAAGALDEPHVFVWRP